MGIIVKKVRRTKKEMRYPKSFQPSIVSHYTCIHSQENSHHPSYRTPHIENPTLSILPDQIRRHPNDIHLPLLIHHRVLHTSIYTRIHTRYHLFLP